MNSTLLYLALDGDLGIYTALRARIQQKNSTLTVVPYLQFLEKNLGWQYSQEFNNLWHQMFLNAAKKLPISYAKILAQMDATTQNRVACWLKTQN